MSLLASDFEESFAASQMGSICEEAYFEWIAYVIDKCPIDIYEDMSNDIIRAFFYSDPIIFVDMFGQAVASTIYHKGHMLSFMHTACFIERKEISFAKALVHGPTSSKFICHLHIYLGHEEIGRLQLPVDAWPSWEEGKHYSTKNPYYYDECS